MTDYPSIARQKYASQDGNVDVEKLIEGYDNLYGISQETYKRSQELEQRLEALEFSSDERMNPQDRVDARQALSEVGVPYDAITAVVRETIDQTLNPMIDGWKARQTLASTYPDFEKSESELADFIASNSELKREYQRVYENGSPRVAMEWAYSQFQRHKANQHPRDRQRETNPMDAMLHSSTGGDRAFAAEQSSSEEFEQARKIWDQTGDVRPYLRLRMKGQIPPEHFNAPF